MYPSITNPSLSLGLPAILLISLLCLGFLIMGCATTLEDFYQLDGIPVSGDTNTPHDTNGQLSSSTLESKPPEESTTSNTIVYSSGDELGPGPQITINSPAQADITGSDILLEGIAEDDDGVVNVEVKIDGQPFKKAHGTTSFSYIFTDMTYGEHTITVYASDAVGDIGEATVTFTVQEDSVKPMVTITKPEANQWVAGDWTYVGTASDNVSLELVELSIDGGPYAAVEGLESWTYDATALDNGWHSITVRAIDVLGNEAMEEVVYRVENNAPQITFTSPEPGITIGGNVTVTGTATDAAESGVDLIELQVQEEGTPADDGAWSPATGTESWSWEWDASSAIPATNYVFYVRGTDVVGNTGNPEQQTNHIGKWNKLGDTINSDTTNYNTQPHLLYYNNTPYLAHIDKAAGVDNVYVKEWDGADWQIIGSGSLNIDAGKQASEPRIYFDEVTDDLYCTWEEKNGSNNYQIYVKKWDGASWSQIGGTVSHTGSHCYHPDVAICQDATPYPMVVYQSGQDAFVRYWNTTSWQTLGGGALNNTGRDEVDYTFIYFKSGEPLIPRVLYYERDYNDHWIEIRKYTSSWVGDGTVWSNINSWLSQNVYNMRYDLISNNTPMVTYRYGPNNRIYVRYYDGSSWVQLGSELNEWAGFAAFNPSIAVDLTTDTPYVSFHQQNPTYRWCYVKTWNGTDWETFGGEIINTYDLYDSYASSLFFNPDTSVPHIVFDEWDTLNRNLYYKRY